MQLSARQAMHRNSRNGVIMKFTAGLTRVLFKCLLYKPPFSRVLRRQMIKKHEKRSRTGVSGMAIGSVIVAAGDAR